MECVKVTDEHREASSSADRYALLKHNIKRQLQEGKNNEKEKAVENEGEEKDCSTVQKGSRRVKKNRKELGRK